MAFAPGRLAMLNVTAGCSSAASALAAPVTEEHVLRWLFRAVFDFRDFAQVNRPALKHAHHHVAHVLRAGQETAGLDDHFTIVAGQSAGDGLPVGLAEHRHDFRHAEIARGQPERIKQHAQLSFRAADDRGLGDERHLLHRVVHLRHEPPQA